MVNGEKAPKGLLLTGVILLVLSLGGCGFGCASFVGFIGDLTDVVQGTSTNELGQSTSFVASNDNAIILTSSSSAVCEVTDSGGNLISLQEPGAGTTGTIQTDEGEDLEFQYSFETDSGETYSVLCSDEFGPGQYAVVPFSVSRILGGVAGLAIGAVLFLVGLVLLIVGLVRRSKWKKRQQPGPMGFAPPPPGMGAPGYGQPTPPGYGQPTPPGYGQPGYGQPQPPAQPTPPPPPPPAPPEQGGDWTPPAAPPSS